MKILVTGAAGFIGSHVALSLLNRGDSVFGIDNHNSYYDQKLKEARLQQFIGHRNYSHLRINLEDDAAVKNVFDQNRPDMVINLAAQAGVRYSIENPSAYIDSNLKGFLNILEGCRNFNVKHLVYASSSSVYGANTNTPFSVHHQVSHPLSLYAATKQSNELMAHSYSHLFSIPCTGARLFTVYGPWGRPDMALYKFTQAILSGETIKIFNHGQHRRDFTYIDDVVKGILLMLDSPPTSDHTWDSINTDPSTSSAPWRIYNIGSNNQIDLMSYIETLEEELGTKAKKEFINHQAGDITDTYANTECLRSGFNFEPKTTIKKGVGEFVKWYKNYHQIQG